MTHETDNNDKPAQAPAAQQLTAQDLEDMENIIMRREPQGGPNFRSFRSTLGEPRGDWSYTVQPGEDKTRTR